MNKSTMRTTLRTKSGKEHSLLCSPQDLEVILSDHRLQKWLSVPTTNGEMILFLDAIESAAPDPYTANISYSSTR